MAPSAFAVLLEVTFKFNCCFGIGLLLPCNFCLYIQKNMDFVNGN